MYYSLFQEHDYLYTGRNSTTKEKAVNDGIDYVLSDLCLSRKEQMLVLTLSLDEKENYLSASANIIVEGHNEKFAEE